MDKELLHKSEQLSSKRKKKKIWKSIVSALACIVVFCTTYALILPAITMEAKTFCGQAEHSHSDECYKTELVCTLSDKTVEVKHEHNDSCYEEKNELVCGQKESTGHSHTDSCKKIDRYCVCGQEESEEHSHTDDCYKQEVSYVCGQEESTGHSHTDDCYSTEKKLVCEKTTETSAEKHVHGESCYDKKLVCDVKEHKHDKKCYSNPAADVETAEEWEETLPDELTGVWVDDVLAVADSQLGYKESTKNYIVDEKGKTKGYSRYGHWYGDKYGHWCAMFVSFCLNYADVDETLIPHDASCQNWIDTLSEEPYNLYHEAGEYEPVPGDLIFFNWDNLPDSDHVGLVYEIIEATDDHGVQIKTIEGNASNTVKYRTYDIDDNSIMGYGQLPKNPDEKVEEEVVEEEAIEEVNSQNTGYSLRSSRKAVSLANLAGDTWAPENVELGVDWGENIAKVAESQVGTVNSSDGTIKYSTWYKEKFKITTNDWANMFASYCIYYANVDTDIVPIYSGYSNESWMNELKAAGLYHEKGTYIPKRGDLMVHKFNHEKPYETAIITDITNGNDITNIGTKVISLNTDGSAYVQAKKEIWTSDGRVYGFIEIPVGEIESSGDNYNAVAKFALNDNQELLGATLVINKLDPTDTRDDLVNNTLCPTGSSVQNNHYYEIYFEKNGSRITPDGDVIIDLSFVEPLDSNKSTGINSGEVSWQLGTINSTDTEISPLLMNDKEENSDSDIVNVKFNYAADAVYVFSATQEEVNTLSTKTGNIKATVTANATILSDDMELVVKILNEDENTANWTEELHEKYVTEKDLIAGNQFFKVEIQDGNGNVVTFPENAKVKLCLDFDPDVVPTLGEEKEIESGEWKLNAITMNGSEVSIKDFGEEDVVDVVMSEQFALDKLTMLYDSHEVLAATAVVGNPDYLNEIRVSSFDDLAAVIQNAGTKKLVITITDDFTSTGTISIPNGKKIEVDLNGHTISANTTLFAVDGGKLILKDSKQNGESTTTGGSNVTGNQAAYDSFYDTLTYYVTESTITNTQVGSTSETLTTHTVVLDGKIDGSGSYEPIIKVTSGTFDQRSGAIVGAKNRAISQSGGTFNLKGGYICGNTTSEGKDKGKISGGAIYTTGKSTINISGTVLAANTAAERGGAISVESWEGATVNVTGGVISGNACTSNIDSGKNDREVHVGGGGIFTKGKVAINMSGGYITNNISRATGYLDGGGGVFISGETVFTLNGGYITGNYAESGGGGIRSDFWDHYTTFNFNGGFVSSNKANLAEGGGVSINWGGVAYISGGYVTNNVTNTKQHWGGGGVFVSNGAKMYVIHALVTANRAGGFGGGLAGCSTGRVFLITDNGGAIYDNIANGKTVTEGSEKAEDKIYGLYNPVFMKSGFNDYFCALTSTVEGNMLGGGPANWKGSADEVPITIGKDESHTASYIMGLTADPSQESINAAITEARVTNGIYIHNNNSNTHGGGVLCNGYLVVGNKDELENSTSLELTAKKTLLNEKEEVIPLGEKDEEGKLIEGTLKEFKFVIKDEADTVIATGKNDVDGNISFSARIPFKKVGTYVYYVYEDVETNSEGYLMDTRKYKMTITVDVDASVMNQITLKQYKITHVKIERNSNGEWELCSESDIGWKSEYEYSPVKIDPTGGASFTNYEMDSGTTRVTVTKKWAGTTPENTSVDVTLYQGDKAYSGSNATVKLNSSNNWTYTWNDLPRNGANGERYIYSVREDVPDGYTVSYDTYNEVSTNNIWVPYTEKNLQEDMEYIIVSPDGTKALYLTSGHADSHLTSDDKVDVTKQSRLITIDGKEYTDYYFANTITERNIYKASTGNLYSGATGTRMLNKSTNSALLIQPENGLNLKDGTGVGGGWVSAFYLSDGMLVGYKEWFTNTDKYIICYDSEAEKFEALPLNDENKSKAAKLYVAVHGNGTLSSETSVLITNTKNEDLEYGFKVTKVSDEYVGDAEQDNHQNIPLAGAKFELRDASNKALRFTRIADGVYEWYSGTLTDEAIESTTTELITNVRGKLAVSGLPAGTYTLVETEAPNGYEKAKPETIVLGSESGSDDVELTIVDKKSKEGSFVLPETGGSGTNIFTITGLLLLMISTLLYIKMKNQMKGGQSSTRN